MTRHYGDIAFTDSVEAAQKRYGSRSFYARRARRSAPADGPDPLTPDVVGFLAGRDSIYLATVSETGWPYVQFRGGPRGFVRVLGEHTLGWADFRGNLQYVSVGNLAHDDRVALIAMDYPSRDRLKVFGHARVVFAGDDPELVAALAQPEYEAVVERAVVVSVDAFDWNCQQHITPRWTEAELEPLLGGLHARIADLEAEIAALRAAGPADGGSLAGSARPEPVNERTRGPGASQSSAPG